MNNEASYTLPEAQDDEGRYLVQQNAPLVEQLKSMDPETVKASLMMYLQEAEHNNYDGIDKNEDLRAMDQLLYDMKVWFENQ